MLKLYINSPTFYTGAELSATDINILKDNASLLQGLSKRSQTVFGITDNLTGYNSGDNIFRGGFLYKVGLTTATIVYISNISSSPPGDARMRIYFEGVEVHARAITTETVTINITINDKGYTDNQIITVECILTGDYDPTPDSYYINAAYVSPLSGAVASSYPGTTTFGDISATNLNNLSNSLDWLADRLALVPYIPLTTLRDVQGTHYISLVHKWRGKIYVDSNNSRLYISVEFTSRTTATYLRFVVNSTTFDYGPYSENQTANLEIDINLITQAGCSVGNEYHVDMYENLTDELDTEPKYNSRINLKSIRVGASSYSYTTPPAESTMLESITFSTLQSRLNTIKTITDSVKTTIDGVSYIFNNALMFRARYGNNAFQQEYFQDEHVVRHKRIGDVLWVKGRGLSIGYGAVTTTTKGNEEKYTYEYQYSESLTSGDKIESKYFYLDQFKALYPGSEYYIFGRDIIYVGEYLK